MPVYAYQCNNCGVQFERIQKFSDDPIRRCPECEEEAVRRIIQPAGIIFKGSGWYVKDSKSSNSAAPGKSSEKGESDSSGSSDSNGSTDSSSSSSSSDSGDSSSAKKSESKSND